ncbi:MAG: fibronectin type III-like domain-contianing protein [Promethearchaeota archaeon]
MTMQLKVADLAYYDVVSNDWVVEKIEYVVYIGPSSWEKDLLKTTFQIS